LLVRLLSGLAALTASVEVAENLLGLPVVSWRFAFDERLSRSTYLLLTLAVGLVLVATVLSRPCSRSVGTRPSRGAGWVGSSA
jgi:hypothetical protein